MRRSLGTLVLIMLAAFAAFGQSSDGNADVKAAILKLESANNTAKLKGDLNAINTLYAGDYAGINAGGGKTVRSDLDFYGEDGSLMAVHQTDDLSVRVIGKSAIVTGRLKYQYNDRMESRTVRWMRYTRIYEQRGAAWVIVAEHFVFIDDPAAKAN